MQRNGNENQLGLNACMLAPTPGKGKGKKVKIEKIEFLLFLAQLTHPAWKNPTYFKFS